MAHTDPAPEGSPEQLEMFDAEVRLFCRPDEIQTILAAPMSLGDYMKLRGWLLCEFDDPHTAGYVVERPDFGPPQPGFKHFIAWIPKQGFDRYFTKAVSHEAMH